MSAAEAAARARQIQAELEALKAAAEEEAKGHAMVWKTHKNLANHRVALERAKHEMEQLSEDIVDIELALDTAHSRTEGQYAQWRCRRATAGVLACLASLAVFFSAALGTHSSRRWASPVGLFVLLDGEAKILVCEFEGIVWYQVEEISFAAVIISDTVLLGESHVELFDKFLVKSVGEDASF